MRIVYTISPCSYMFMYPYFHSISPYCYVYVSKLPVLFHHISVCYVSMFSLYFTILLCLCIQGTRTISPYYLYIMCPSFLSCFLCVRTFYSISLYWYVMCPSFLFCFLCVRTFYSISSYLSCMFMCPHLCTISPCILIVRVMYPYLYAISPYIVVCLCVHVFSLFHYITMFMFPRYLHYFTILFVYYVSKLFILFLMCQDFLLCFTIRYVFMYPCFCSISPYILIIYVMYPNYSHYFTT
jgi:hypothetical protein